MPDKKRSNDNQITNVNSQAVAPVSNQALDMEGMVGFDRSDLPLPTVKLVHGTSKNTEMLNGDKAPIGSFFHTSKKEAKKAMSIVILYSVKNEIPDYKNPDVMNPGVRILAVDVDDLNSPFVIQLVKGGYWTFKNLLGTFNAWKITKPWTRLVVLGNKEVKSKDGDDFLVTTLELGEELLKEDLAVVEQIRAGFVNFSKVTEVIDDDQPTITPVELDGSFDFDLDTAPGK